MSCLDLPLPVGIVSQQPFVKYILSVTCPYRLGVVSQQPYVKYVLSVTCPYRLGIAICKVTYVVAICKVCPVWTCPYRLGVVRVSTAVVVGALCNVKLVVGSRGRRFVHFGLITIRIQVIRGKI